MKRVIVIISAIISFLWLCSFSVYAQRNETFTGLGRGTIYDIAFSPDSTILAVATSRGIYFHNPADFAEIAFIDLGEFPVGLNNNSICFSPDGKLLASSTINKTGLVILWDTTNYERVAEIKAGRYTGLVYSIRFSPDGGLIAFGGDDGKIRLLDVVGREEIGMLEGHGKYIRSICFSPDGSLLASVGADDTIKLWDMATHKVIKTFSHPAGNAVFSPDGKLLAIGEFGIIRLYDIKQKKERATNIPPEFSGLIDFSPDGKLLASGSLKLWNVDDLKEVTAPAVDFVLGLEAVRFSPDGRFLVRAGYCQVMILDMKTQKEIKAPNEYGIDAFSVAISSDSRLLATGGFDDLVGLWDLESHKLVSTFRTFREPWNPLGSLTSSMAISPDNRFLAAGSLNDKVTIWSIKDNKEFAVVDAKLTEVNTVAFSLDSKLLAFGGPGGLELWDMQTKKEVPLDGDAGNVSCVAFSPDGKLLASGGEDKVVHLWDLKKLKEAGTLRSLSVIRSLAFSPDGRWLAIGCANQKVRLWDMSLFKEAATFSVISLRPTVAFNSNGCLLAIGNGYKVELWDVGKQSKVATFPYSIYVTSVCFSPDGRLLAIGTIGEVILWDMQPYADICGGQLVEPDGKLPFSWGEIKSENKNVDTPSNFVLEQNYPNPFNPETWIPYRLKEAGNVSIDIYDASSHLVHSISSGRKEAGVYNDKTCAAYWDGRNDKGEKAPAGVYFYILRTDSFQSNPRKMILLK